MSRVTPVRVIRVVGVFRESRGRENGEQSAGKHEIFHHMSSPLICAYLVDRHRSRRIEALRAEIKWRRARPLLNVDIADLDLSATR
jgi:hypothetical protein